MDFWALLLAAVLPIVRVVLIWAIGAVLATKRLGVFILSPLLFTWKHLKLLFGFRHHKQSKVKSIAGFESTFFVKIFQLCP